MAGIAQIDNNSDLYGEDKLPNLYMVIEDMAAAYPSMIDVLFNTENITTDIYQTTTLSGIKNPVVRAQLEPVEFDTIKQGYSNTITVAERSAGYAISKIALDDGKVNYVDRATKSFAKGAFEEKEYNHAGIFDDAFTVSGYDGVPLCSASHPLENGFGGTDSNLVTGAALTRTSLKALRNVLQNAVDSNGRKQMYNAAYIVYPQALQDTVKEILGSEFQPENANNAINTLVGFTNVLPGVGYWPYLGSSTAFFLVCPKEQTGLMHIKREAYNIVYDQDVHTRVHKYSSHERYGFGVSHHRGIFGNEGA